MSATVGVDYAWSGGLIGLAVSHTEVDADYGVAGQTAGTLKATLTGLYPYFGAQLGERFSVWGLAGSGEGEQTDTSGAAEPSLSLEIESELAGLGARAEILSAEGGFSLAAKTDALLSRARFADEALPPGQGLPPGVSLLAAEGEWRRMRLGLEASWQAEFANGASLRSSLEASGLEDSGDAENGLGAELGANLRVMDLVPGLSLTLGVRGLLSHDVKEYEEWGGSGGLRYDPSPESPAGPLVSLTHSWGASRTAALTRAPGSDGLPPSPSPALAPRTERLSAQLAWGLHAFGGLGVPWAQVGHAGPDREYRLGYRLITHRGIPAVELGRSAFAHDYAVSWAFAVRCRAHFAVEVRHTAAGPYGPADTGFELSVRSIAPGAACDMAGPKLDPGLPP